MKLIKLTTSSRDPIYVNAENIAYIVNSENGNSIVFFVGGSHEEIEGLGDEQGILID
jgi:hypothetical protein